MLAALLAVGVALGVPGFVRRRVAGAVTLLGGRPLDAEAVRVATLLLTGATIAALAAALRDRHEQLERQATTDVLTGIGNRRAFEHALATSFAHAERFRSPSR